MHGSRELADDFTRGGIDDWPAEDYLDHEEAKRLRKIHLRGSGAPA
jgi:hypothetical protein